MSCSLGRLSFWYSNNNPIKDISIKNKENTNTQYVELSNERKNDLQKQPNHPSKLDEWSVLLDE